MTSTASTFAIRAALPSDFVAVSVLLLTNKLPIDGIPRSMDTFLVAEQDGIVIGTIGLVCYGPDVLLRSAVVNNVKRGMGLGSQLMQAIIADAVRRGAETLWLLTTTVESWAQQFGFAVADRSTVPASLLASPAFQGTCSTKATVMRRTVAPESSVPPALPSV